MIVLHGENKSLSRKALIEMKEAAMAAGKEVVSLDGLKVKLTELKQAVESGSLFGGEKLVVIEEPKNDIIKGFLGFARDTQHELIIWSGKKLTPTILKALGGREQEFKVSAEIFKLTDSLAPGNQKQMLMYWEKSLQQEVAEMIFFMLSRQIRMMIGAKADPDGLKGNPYVVNKAKQQAGRFSLEQLLNLHEGLYLIDKGVKTGSNPLSLEHQIEMWLLSVG